MRRGRWIAPVAVFGAIALVAGAAAAAGGTQPPAGPVDGDGAEDADVPGEWVDEDAPRRIRAYAEPIAELLGWWDLPTYLVNVAYTESRGNSRACKAPCGQGWSRGWFQLRPNSYCYIGSEFTPEEFLEDEAAQVAIAACHARRLGIVYDEPGQIVQWQDIRHGWKIPKRTGRSYRDTDTTLLTDQHFEKALKATGTGKAFMFRKAFPDGLDVPHVSELLAAARTAA